MESVAAAAVLGFIVIVVIHAFNGGDSLKRWSNFVFTGRGPGRDVTRPSWGIVAGQVQTAAADIAAGIGVKAEQQQARANRMRSGTSTPADVRAESSLAAAAIAQALPTFRPAPTRLEAGAASAVATTPGATQSLTWAGKVAQRVAGLSGTAHAQGSTGPSWADSSRLTRVAISDILDELAQRAKAAR